MCVCIYICMYVCMNVRRSIVQIDVSRSTLGIILLTQNLIQAYSFLYKCLRLYHPKCY